MCSPMRVPMGPTCSRKERMGTNIMFDICYGLTLSPNYMGTAIRIAKQAEQLNPYQSDPSTVVRR